MKFLTAVCCVILILPAGGLLAQDPNALFANANALDDGARADKGDVKAQLRLGYRFLTGVNCAPDARRAARHFAAAAEQSRWPSASAWLGFTYASAPELGRSAEGLVMIQDAEISGDAVAKTLHGRLLQLGAGMPRDLERAKQLYLEVAPRFALAQTYLAEIYLGTPGPSPSDAATAQALLIKAAGTGEPKSMLHLAYFHLRGFGGQKDLHRAAYWLDRAAERGDRVAIYQRGVFFGKGWGGAKSEKTAVDLFKRSAQMGYAPAQAALGMCYSTGKGVDRSMSLALKWFGMAAAENEFAARQLASLQAKTRDNNRKK